MKYTLIATATFGLESVVANELKNLGYEDIKVENSKVEFKGDERDIARCNLWLRTADRVLIKVDEFKAESFEELFEGTKRTNWGDIIPEDGKMHIVGKSIKSKLFSVPDCQSIVKKAVVESMKTKYKTDWFSEEGPVYKIEVAILKDIVTLTIDTSGRGLHKRGYREGAGQAPLKETLAAALVLLSRWNPSRTLIDPLCGSGTILIEAALIGKNIAPGLKRDFVSETWPNIKKEVWDELRQEAKDLINDKEFKILGSDNDFRVLNTAKENIRLAGLEEYIYVQKLSVEELSSKKKYGCIITNPPYGERMGEIKEVNALYKQLGKIGRELDTWSVFIITSHPEFQKHYGKKATKNRKLYNGTLQCYYYQYFGPLPPRIREPKPEEVIEGNL
ncbi:MAG: class I SAM-dependent RNA methyltransferase [Clostridium sp.]